jgi:archaellum component FlaC
MTNSQFDKLYNHMTERFDSLHDEVGDVKKEVRGIYSHLDEIRELLDSDELERGAQSMGLTGLTGRSCVGVIL